MFPSSDNLSVCGCDHLKSQAPEQGRMSKKITNKSSTFL